ncbi:MAG: helix-hairpin-helix domain-containing protein [Elainellaceae cyanobacterium]
MELRRWVRDVRRSLDGATRTRMSEIRQNPYCRLYTSDDVAIAVDLGLFIDANRAAVDDWLRLPHLSIHQAKHLVSLRQVGVTFYCLEDLSVGLGVSAAAFQPFVALIQFQYYAVDESNLGGLDPNCVPLATLAQLPGVSESTARAIVAAREVEPFGSLVDLQRRLGLSRDVVNQLLHYLRF